MPTETPSISRPFLKPSMPRTMINFSLLESCYWPCGFTSRLFFAEAVLVFIWISLKAENTKARFVMLMSLWSNYPPSCWIFLETRLIKLKGGKAKPNSLSLDCCIALVLVFLGSGPRLYIEKVDDRSLMQKDLIISVPIYKIIFWKIGT